MPTPVALFLFNRPETTRQVFDEIAKYRPSTLLVIADGPRTPEEKVRCDEARRIVDGVDWDCKVLRHYSESNLGCKHRMSSGVSWVFEQVEEAIILEDDCLPHLSFFSFCDQLLERFRDDQRIGLISGFNCGISNASSASYYFSSSVSVWGWASWRRSWALYDLDMQRWPALRATNWLERSLGARTFVSQWTEIFDRTYAGKVDTWDYQWVFACFAHSMLSVVPTRNLIRNIGFGPSATHTSGAENPLAAVPLLGVEFPLHHPSTITPDTGAESLIMTAQLGPLTRRSVARLIYRARRKVQRVLKRMISPVLGT